MRAGWADALRPWLEDPGHAGVLSDFDGTLAPIVPVPDEAAPLPAVPGLLGVLAGRLGLVAVVSGRPVRFLADRLAGAGDRIVLVGLYGLERMERGRVVTDADAEVWRPAVAAAVSRARDLAPPGVGVEDKGLTVTLHARRAPSQMSWVASFAADVAQRDGLGVHPGRLAVELRPPVAVDKGTVVFELAAGLGSACYVGDDHGDLPAFAALAARRAEGATTLAVAAASDEAPAELLAGADLVVGGPAEVVELLTALAGA